MSQTTYEVYLTDDDQIDTAVSSDRLDFYDSGVWVESDDGRVFYPYGRIRKIREVQSEPSETAAPETEPAGIEYEE